VAPGLPGGSRARLRRGLLVCHWSQAYPIPSIIAKSGAGHGHFSQIFGTWSATAGDRLGGVRPSSGAAMSERERAPNGIGRIGTTGAGCARGRAHSDNVVVRRYVRITIFGARNTALRSDPLLPDFSPQPGPG